MTAMCTARTECHNSQQYADHETHCDLSAAHPYCNAYVDSAC